MRIINVDPLSVDRNKDEAPELFFFFSIGLLMHRQPRNDKRHMASTWPHPNLIKLPSNVDPTPIQRRSNANRNSWSAVDKFEITTMEEKSRQGDGATDGGGLEKVGGGGVGSGG